MEKYESINSPETPVKPASLRFFTVWVILSQVLGLSAVIMVGAWLGHYRGGFAWQEDPGKEFNYHPLFMTIGFIFLYGDSILVYRVFRNEKKTYSKFLHAGLLLLSLIFAAVGLKAVFDSHNLPDPPHANMYTLHSWLGIITVALYSFQWIGGLLMFLLPICSDDLKGIYKPAHTFWGMAIFILAIATALMGLTEKAIWGLGGDYEKKTSEGLLMNAIGIVFVALGATVIFIVSNSNWRRQQLPEEERMQLAG